MKHGDTTPGGGITRRGFCRGAAVGTAGVFGVIGFGGTVTAADEPPLVTTRGHFDVSWGSVVRDGSYDETEYGTNGRVPALDTDTCPSDLTVFVHGFKTKAGEAGETVHEVDDALSTHGYDGTTIGFEWDSDQGLWNWWETTDIAAKNGPKLAAFTRDYTDVCDGVVRLIGYSLGSQVILSALEKLDEWDWDGRVETVSLLGAAADTEAVSTGGNYGSVIERRAGRFDNYWNSGDSILNWAYGLAEWSDALGSNGIDGPAPSNYEDHNVDYVSGHFEYYDAEDGCMDEVVDNW